MPCSEGRHDSGKVLFHGDVDEEGVYNRPPSSTLFFYPVELEQDVATDINKASEGHAVQVEPLLVRVVHVMHYRHLRGKKERIFLSTCDTFLTFYL